jgi:MYXO-CTERM domain-containing protein
MTRTILFRRIVAVVGVMLALATAAGPASAKTFGFNSNGSLVLNSNGSHVQGSAPSASPRANPATSGTGIEWGYIAIGSSAAALVLIGVGAAATGRRRSREDRSQRATIAG